jgi:hypothetical protein
MLLPSTLNTRALSLQVSFPSTPAVQAYCPAAEPQGMGVCSLRAHPGPDMGMGSTLFVSQLCSMTQVAQPAPGFACNLSLALPQDGEWHVALLPSTPLVRACNATVALPAIHATCIVDTVPPLLSLALARPPVVGVPEFMVALEVSEPVAWVAAASTVPQAAVVASPPPGLPRATNETGTSPLPTAPSAATTVPGILFSIFTGASSAPQAVWPLNVTCIDAGQHCSAWFRALPGTTVEVKVPAAAYADVVGNTGAANESIMVRQPWVNGQVGVKALEQGFPGWGGGNARVSGLRS